MERRKISRIGFPLLLTVIAGLVKGQNYTWTGYITMNPVSGIVGCGDSIGMTVSDSFTFNLPEDEYLVTEGEPTYEWFVNDSETCDATGRTVTFTTGDDGEGADIGPGDFTVSVKGSRMVVYAMKCRCGCGDNACECGGGASSLASREISPEELGREQKCI